MSAHAIAHEPPYQTETLHHWIEDGVRHHQEGRFDQAQMVYEAILAADPDQVMILSLLGLIHHQHGDSATGEKLIRRAITLSPESGFLHDHLALTLDAMGDEEGAMEAHADSVILDPTHAPGWYNLGMMMMRRGRDEDALRCIMRALDLDSRNPIYRTGFGHVLTKLEHPTEAADAYRLALLADPRYTEAYVGLSALWTEFGHAGDARCAADAAQQLRDGASDPGSSFAQAMFERIAATFPSTTKH
jgi:tetratricopeptide (TPR) repeat protein